MSFKYFRGVHPVRAPIELCNSSDRGRRQGWRMWEVEDETLTVKFVTGYLGLFWFNFFIYLCDIYILCKIIKIHA